MSKRKLYSYESIIRSRIILSYTVIYDFYNFTSAYISYFYDIYNHILKKYFDDFEIRKIPNKVRSMTHR